jgi:hypothetical protein
MFTRGCHLQAIGSGKFQRLSVYRAEEEHGRAPCGAEISHTECKRKGTERFPHQHLLSSRWFFVNLIPATRPIERPSVPRASGIPSYGAEPRSPCSQMTPALSRRGFLFLTAESVRKPNLSYGLNCGASREIVLCLSHVEICRRRLLLYRR